MAIVIEHELGAVAGELGLAIDAEAWARLDALVELWLRYGRAINLTAARTRVEVARHVHDGLATAAVVERARPLRAETRWLDVGSGAGFPALVVAAIRPVAMVLVEPRERRAAFLELAARVGACGPIDVRRERVALSTWRERGAIGKLEPDFLDFHVLSSRAVFPAAAWLDLGVERACPGAIVVVHGRLDRWPDRAEPIGSVEGATGLVSAFGVRG
jgi:16S rRNA (guanine527-N7)-methyltransferase